MFHFIIQNNITMESNKFTGNRQHSLLYIQKHIQLSDFGVWDDIKEDWQQSFQAGSNTVVSKNYILLELDQNTQIGFGEVLLLLPEIHLN